MISISMGIAGQLDAAGVFHSISGGIVELDHQVLGSSIPSTHMLPTKIHSGML